MALVLALLAGCSTENPGWFILWDRWAGCAGPGALNVRANTTSDVENVYVTVGEPYLSYMHEPLTTNGDGVWCGAFVLDESIGTCDELLGSELITTVSVVGPQFPDHYDVEVQPDDAGFAPCGD